MTKKLIREFLSFFIPIVLVAFLAFGVSVRTLFLISISCVLIAFGIFHQDVYIPNARLQRSHKLLS